MTFYLRKLSSNKEYKDDAEKLCSLVSIPAVGAQVSALMRQVVRAVRTAQGSSFRKKL